MNIKDNEVYTFKLGSGEEIVAKVSNSDTDNVYIVEPLAVAPGPQGPALMQGIFTTAAGSTVALNKRHIAMTGETDDNVKQKYIKVTTGIDVPSKKLILG
jgi:hypothetical protein